MEVKQLRNSLNAQIPHARFHPKVKKKIWDGYIRYFHNDTYVPAGLWGHIEDVAKDYGYDLEIEGLERKFDDDVTYEEIEQFCWDKLEGHEMDPRPYQIETVYQTIVNKCCSHELGTSAGKTLINFLIFKYLLETGRVDKCLMVVPRTDLVIQGYDDFKDYDMGNSDLKVQQIYEGAEMKEGMDIYIGTYQTLDQFSKEEFDNIGVVCVDEMHQAKSETIKSILQKTLAKRRYGMTGTFPDPEKKLLDYLTVMAFTGPLISKIKVSELQEKGYIAKSKVYQFRLRYKDESAEKGFYRLRHSGDGSNVLEKEKEYVRSSEMRMKFVEMMVDSSERNILLLFNKTDYGKRVYDRMMNAFPDRKVFYIDGNVDYNVRTDYREQMEETEGAIMVASFGTFSLGINVNNLFTVMFLESFKSDIIIKQSIGRGLRKKGDKILTIIDLVDDLRLRVPKDSPMSKSSKEKRKNLLLRHGEERVGIYKDEGHDYEIEKVTLPKVVS